MLQPGFHDPVRQSQSVFRLAMDALSRPGTIHILSDRLASPAPLLPSAASLLLTLCDFETPVWLDRELAESAEVCGFLRFHTGAKLVPSPGEAAFAVVSRSAHLPPLAGFRQGTREYPDRSSTIVVQVETLEQKGWMLEGPGILDAAMLHAAPLPDDFMSQLRANRAQFPCGVDIFFAAGHSIAALPRSVRVTEGA